MRIVVNVYRDHERLVKRRSLETLVEDRVDNRAMDPAQIASTHELEQRIVLAINRLPSQQRLVTVLVLIEKLSVTETAEWMGMGEYQEYDKSISFDPRIIGDDARLNLAVALVRQGQLSKAETHFKHLLCSSDRAAEAKLNLNAIADLKRQHSKSQTRRFKQRKRRRYALFSGELT